MSVNRSVCIRTDTQVPEKFNSLMHIPCSTPSAQSFVLGRCLLHCEFSSETELHTHTHTTIELPQLGLPRDHPARTTLCFVVQHTHKQTRSEDASSYCDSLPWVAFASFFSSRWQAGRRGNGGTVAAFSLHPANTFTMCIHAHSCGYTNTYVDSIPTTTTIPKLVCEDFRSSPS